MPSQAWVTLGILVVMFALLIWDRLPAWLVFVGTLTAAMTLKLASADAPLKGFSNTGVMTVAVLFPVAAGMYATGAISLLSQRMVGLPRSVLAAQLRNFPPVALGSAFLNNTPLVAMMIPVVRDLTRVTGLARSKLFMGLSFASILGGTMTTIGTSVNLIIAGLVADAMASGHLTGMKPLTIFEPIWVGLPATVAGLLFMMLFGTRLLPDDRQQSSADSARRVFRVELRVQPQSNLDGKTLEAAGFANPVGYSLLSVTRGGAAVEITSTLKMREEMNWLSPCRRKFCRGCGRRSGWSLCMRGRLPRRVTDINSLRWWYRPSPRSWGIRSPIFLCRTAPTTSQLWVARTTARRRMFRWVTIGYRPVTAEFWRWMIPSSMRTGVRPTSF